MKAAAAAAMLFAAAAAPGAAADGLSSVMWEFRPLLIFAPSDDAARLSRQTTMLADEAAGMTDRKMGVFIVERNRVFTTFGAPALRADARAVRLRYRVPDDAFTVILVGLDGGAKLRVDAPVAPEKRSALIDWMPMRRRELRQRGDL